MRGVPRTLRNDGGEGDDGYGFVAAHEGPLLPFFRHAQTRIEEYLHSRMTHGKTCECKRRRFVCGVHDAYLVDDMRFHKGRRVFEAPVGGNVFV